jgi:16S rRNA (cytidine1402-2'-O)-methyltransferase
VSRELTKKFEENFRGTIKEVHEHFSEKGVKGEIVIVIAGKEK